MAFLIRVAEINASALQPLMLEENEACQVSDPHGSLPWRELLPGVGVGEEGWLLAAPEVTLLLCRIQLHPTALGLNELDYISTLTGSVSLAWF